MKLYVTTYIDDAAPDGALFGQKWAGTQAQQAQDAKQLHTEGMRNILRQHVDVPTGKAGLLQFLNDKGVRP